MAAEIAIFGHSFICHLARYIHCTGGWPNMGFVSSAVRLSFLGLNGGTLHRGNRCILNRPNLARLDAIRPRVVFMQAGGNDLSSAECSPERLAAGILSAAEYLITGHGVHHVIIGQLLPRFSSRCRPDYNEKVTEVNNRVCKMAADSALNVTFWHHRGFFREPKSLIAGDGTHLNTHGMRKYARSVRAAIILAKKRGSF